MTNLASPPRVPSVDDLVRVFDEIDRFKAVKRHYVLEGWCSRCQKTFVYHKRLYGGRNPTICNDCKKP